MYGVVLIFVLVVTGGAIAFIGDRLGTKVGKKKMSIFGLRPRHTSILVTIVTGVMITTTTLGIMSVMSENVRTALFGMEELHRSMQQARSELADASGQLAVAKAEREKIQAELNNTRRELSGLEEQKDRLELQTRDLQDVNGRLEAANQLLAGNNHELLQKSDKLTRINNILEEGNERLSKNNAELYRVNRELTTGIQIMREGAIAFQAGEALAGGIIKGMSSVDDIHKEMGRLLDMARYSVIRKLGSDVRENEKDVWIYQPEFEEAASYISEHEGEFVVRIVAAGNLIQGEAVAANLQLFANRPVYADGELLVEKRVTFDPHSDAELEAVLTSFLSDVNHKATADGMLSNSVNGSVGVVDAEQIYNLMGQLQRSSGSAVISAFADGAADIVGPLRIRLKFAGAGLLP